jgi:signal transduction histidine kinase
MTIARRVTFSFALILLLFALNLSVHFWTSHQQAASLSGLRAASDRRMALRSIEHELRERRREAAILSEAVLEPSQLAPLGQRLEALTRRSRLVKGEAAAFAELQLAVDRFAHEATAVFVAAAAGRTADARARQQQAAAQASEALATIERLSRQEEARAASATERFFSVAALTHQVSLVTFSLSLFVTLIVGEAVASHLRRGFATLVHGTERIAGGELGSRIEHETEDELGVLAEAFNGMSAQLARAMTQIDQARAAAERASRAKGIFLANMSHEFRTPLTSLLCYADLVRQEAVEAGHSHIAQDAGEIRQAAEHLMSLVNQVVDLARIEAGRLSVTLEEVDVQSVVDRLQHTLRPLAARNGNALCLELPGETLHMTTDALKLRQILLNLLANACKFTSKGTVTLRVAATSVEGEAAVSFVVTDTGIGMTHEQAARIFEEFEQGDPSIERGYGGSGLGLSISKGLCMLLGGGIAVTSEEGLGTTFTVILPARFGTTQAGENAA